MVVVLVVVVLVVVGVVVVVVVVDVEVVVVVGSLESQVPAIGIVDGVKLQSLALLQQVNFVMVISGLDTHKQSCEHM